MESNQYNIGEIDESIRLAEQALKRLASMLRDVAVLHDGLGAGACRLLMFAWWRRERQAFPQFVAANNGVIQQFCITSRITHRNNGFDICNRLLDAMILDEQAGPHDAKCEIFRRQINRVQDGLDGGLGVSGFFLRHGDELVARCASRVAANVFCGRADSLGEGALVDQSLHVAFDHQ